MFKNQDRTEPVRQTELFKVRKRDMPSGERVRLLQEKLYYKAKQERKYKFYVLYDKVLIGYVLQEAYKRVKASGGSPGHDGQTFEAVEEYGLEKFLEELREDLRKQTYKPEAVKRIWIPKANGGERPIGIPIIRDRVAQMACKLIIEPIFEADFEDSSYGFRPNRSAQDAMKVVKGYLTEGNNEVLDADLSAYFDTIPHEKLKKTLEMRIADPRILRLIKLWLKSPVIEKGKNLGKSNKGTPQGGVISPLLANIYMHLVDRIVNSTGSVFEQAGIKIVRFADDFILIGKKLTQEAIDKLRELLARMDLVLNETKTHEVNALEEPFGFLGFTIRYDKDIRGRSKKYWNIIPAAKSEKKAREKIRAYLKTGGHYGPQKVADELNAIIRGWLNYYDVPKVSYSAMSKRRLRYYLINKLYRYYNRKSQRRSRLYGSQAYEILVQKYGLIDPTKYAVAGHL